MTRTTLALTAAALLWVAGPATAREQAASPTNDIVATAVAAGSFTTLVKAVQAAGLVEALQADGPFTVFAPTDAAFAALPEGTVATLLEPANRDTLRRILTFHVVSGSVRSSDLLTAPTAKTLAGESVAFGLRVGNANVTQADIECSNGVIHVIDAVLLPPAKAGNESDMHVQAALTDAIDQGVPLFNDGDEAGCARVYRETARRLVNSRELAELHGMALTAALTAPAADASTEAWALREAFDGILADIAFEPRAEAALPKGFPKAGPIGRIVRKEYPQYRAARADGNSAFWSLFDHIKKHDIPMTAPVEMTMDDTMRMRDMSFMYERPDQGESGADGKVAVLDLEPMKVLSIAMRGRSSAAAIALAKKALDARLAADGLEAAGPWRTLGYSSPMVPDSQKYWELQVPID